MYEKKDWVVVEQPSASGATATSDTGKPNETGTTAPESESTTTAAPTWALTWTTKAM